MLSIHHYARTHTRTCETAGSTMPPPPPFCCAAYCCAAVSAPARDEAADGLKSESDDEAEAPNVDVWQMVETIIYTGKIER